MKLETITRVPKTQTHKTPLLFVHGMWHGAWCWDEFFLPYFADAGYHATALSLRGHAGSEGKITGSSIPPVHREERAGDIRDSLADISKATRELNYQPEVKVEEGLAITLDWFKKAFFS